jgi:uncharacterized membrane protein
MRTGRNALGAGVQMVGVTVGLLLLLAVLAYVVLVLVLVVGQAASTFGS